MCHLSNCREAFQNNVSVKQMQRELIRDSAHHSRVNYSSIDIFPWPLKNDLTKAAII